MTKLLLGCLLLSCAVGCARLDIKHVDKGDSSPGVHFYEPRPYLLVSATFKVDSSGKAQTEVTNQIIWLPNPAREFVANPVPGWGTADTSVKLLNGWMLDSIGSKMDSKIPETITALTGTLKEAAAASKGVLAPGDIDKIIGLYLISIHDDGTVEFIKQANWK
jgi:hypothetical protein